MPQHEKDKYIHEQSCTTTLTDDEKKYKNLTEEVFGSYKKSSLFTRTELNKQFEEYKKDPSKVILLLMMFLTQYIEFLSKFISLCITSFFV